LTLDSDEVLISADDFNDPGGGKATKSLIGSWTVEWGGYTKWVFTPEDSLTVSNTGWFFAPDTKTKFSTYSSYSTVVEGTGRFAGVSGFLNSSGPFMVWGENLDTPPQARWNVHITGTLCDVKPKK
jgi:hypothetical protein